MNPAVEKLIPAIASSVVEHGGYLTKTKLLKLLYLFDVEYFRIHRQTFTGFQWKFFHLGPWAREFDGLLQKLLAQDVLVEKASSRPEFDTKFLRSSESVGIGGLFQSYKDEGALKTILHRWGDKTTGEILDYVYFCTEPMEHGVRNEPLDFSRIAEQRPPTYVRSSSGKNPREIKRTRERFWKDVEARTAVSQSKFDFTPPEYDEEYFDAVARLDSAR
ncbi:MAG: hypothetical protein L0Z53_05995 [Acidobacteriales bacterium]|nr:hypothetical protein [Terriglobales bacterium]MCI0623841.1 hypothetical protein [Acidobacteriota bacterium]MCI0721819.1 hypothetical protein [Acidobacteriota bacterium]